MNKKVNMTLDLMDTRFKISCAPEEKALVIDASELVNTKFQEIRNRGRTTGSERIATMVALNLASEYLRYQDETADMPNRPNPEYTKTLNYLIKRIENTIDELKEVEGS
jgi:cell division protein ZapA